MKICCLNRKGRSNVGKRNERTRAYGVSIIKHSNKDFLLYRIHDDHSTHDVEQRSPRDGEGDPSVARLVDAGKETEENHDDVGNQDGDNVDLGEAGQERHVEQEERTVERRDESVIASVEPIILWAQG